MLVIRHFDVSYEAFLVDIPVCFEDLCEKKKKDLQVRIQVFKIVWMVLLCSCTIVKESAD
jgi:TATA-binding protein-associated factor Taf7